MTELQHKIWACVLCILLAAPSPVRAEQQPPATPTPAKDPVFVPGATPGAQVPGPLAAAAPGVKIVVLEGRRQSNRLSEGTFAVPVVEVRDRNDRPLEGARVTFLLNGGPQAGAMFRDGSLEKTFTSNPQGQATAEGYVPNNIPGKFSIRVRAEFQGENTEIRLEQENTFQTLAEYERQKSRRWRKWAWIGGAAAAGSVVLAVLLTRDGGSASNPTIIVNPGPPVIGGR
jgi:hypothetical protein